MFRRMASLTCMVALAGAAAAASQDEPGGQAEEPAPLVTRSYAVADLVLPIPAVGVVSIGGRVAAARPSDLRTADFEPLVEEIKATIEPASWERSTGAGVIAARPAEMALVVRQTEAVHEQVADLIGRRRRELDRQVAVEFRRVIVSARFFEEAADEVSLGGERRVYDEAAAAELLAAAQSESTSNFDAAPKITLFDGQTIWLDRAADDGDSSVVLNAVISRDRRSVKLSVAATVTKDGDAAILGHNVRVPDRETLLVDCGPTADGARRELLLITPRVIVLEEQEQRPKSPAEGTEG